MVSTSHPNASDLFARDLGGLVKFFAMKMRYVPPNEDLCRLEDIIVPTANIRIDEEVRASGFSKDDDDILLRFINDTKKEVSNDNQGDDDDDDDDDEEEEEEEEEETYSRKKKPSKKSVSRVTDFLNSSNHTVEEEEGDDKEKTFDNFSELKIGENNENGENEENGVSDISSILPKQLHRNENSNGWIPEPKDLLDLEEVLDGFSSDEEGAGGGKGSVAIMTEDMLQKVKDKTRR
jgi:flagellar biosynthesis GTPase FlhF